ncbi:thiamine pyrophosphate-requiring protein [Naasia aerilata]|uniref:Thiamine pyrophosphate-requiring protein n=1 Tax=Naasia aerilata TaxID=1162966 RepID=A0ABM8G996_9MICO|nr:thiamine pyrophosphate-requiring protein [Naasia aerilata]BDZ44763.1 thiamine pyrophosphate-requiring protein [Naasia aerilata]
MADKTVADVVVERLRDWGVHRIFGYSGDGINGFMEALRRADGDPEFVQARHEETAALMAVGHAKYTGGVGVVTSTQGPGAIHLLNGLYDAKLDGVPVVAIVGQQNRSVLGSGYMQEVNLQTLFSDVAAQFCQLVSTPEQVPSVLDRAFRTALATRSPTVVILPHDIQKADAPELEAEHGIVVTAAEFRRPVVTPAAGDLDEAAALLNAGSKVAVLVGQGAKDAQEQVVAVAERLGAGITTSLLGKPYVDETLPFAVGTMGHLGTTASAALLGGCDTLLIVGSNDPWTEFYPQPGQARAVQIDLDGRIIGNRYPIEVGLVGDAATTLTALLERLDERTDRSWRNEVEAEVRRWEEVAETRANVPADPVNPELVVRTLGPRLPADARIALDVGSVVYWYARQLRLPVGVPAHVSGTLASMGCGVPYGIAAKLAAPGQPVVVLTGDGGMQMTGVAELITVARMWEQWEDPRFVVCVLHNGDLAEVTWEQREMEGAPRFVASQALPSFPFAGYADLLGLKGIRVTSPDELEAAWDAALSADRPVVLEVLTDPNIPLLPPFPAGAAKLDSMRAGIDQEDEHVEHTRRLLDTYASHEED